MVECKASRQDFLQDRDKEHRHRLATIGCWFVWFTAPGVIRPGEIGDHEGWYEFDGDSWEMLQGPMRRNTDDRRNEFRMLVDTVHRQVMGEAAADAGASRRGVPRRSGKGSSGGRKAVVRGDAAKLVPFLLPDEGQTPAQLMTYAKNQGVVVDMTPGAVNKALLLGGYLPVRDGGRELFVAKGAGS